MNKAELIDTLAAHFGGNKAEAGRMLNIVLETIMQETARHGRVGIAGFGVFEKIHREERVVRNPRTGERKKSDATHVARFRPGSDMKAYMSGEKDVPAGKKTAARTSKNDTAGGRKTTSGRPVKKGTKG